MRVKFADGASITTRVQANPNPADGFPPVWTVGFHIQECPGAGGCFNVHADSPHDAVAVVSEWSAEDIDPDAVTMTNDGRYVQVLPDDTLVVEWVGDADGRIG